MSSQQAQPTVLNGGIDECRWVIQIRQFIEEDDDGDTGVPVSIFTIPKTLTATKPEAYTPQKIALGPCHHWRPELYEMERYKFAAAKRVHKQLKTLKFQNVVDRFLKSEARIRSCYDRYFDLRSETFAWMLAVDASFLLEFLKIFAPSDGKNLARISSRMSHLVDSSGRRSTHNAILRDILMLENQIPLFLLRKVLNSQFSSKEEADEELTGILMGFCREISPFKKMENFPQIRVTEHAHLLELLYHFLVSKADDAKEIKERSEQAGAIIKKAEEEVFQDSGNVKKVSNMVWGCMSSLNGGLISRVKRVLSRPFKLVVKLPWTVLKKVPGISLLKRPVESLFSLQDQKNTKTQDSNESKNSNRPPSIEEITIASVSDLASIGVRFMATNGDISTIRFDETTVTFYLPTITLDVNTEVILRNLVAFESSHTSGPLAFTRYTELMNGIIDTEADAKLLRSAGIVSNCLKTDAEVASLWNGMSKSVRLTKVPFLDKAIEDANRFYSKQWQVRMRNLMKKYVFESWQFLTFLAASLLLLLTGLQSFCSVYTCARWFTKIGALQE